MAMKCRYSDQHQIIPYHIGLPIFRTLDFSNLPSFRTMERLFASSNTVILLS